MRGIGVLIAGVAMATGSAVAQVPGVPSAGGIPAAAPTTFGAPAATPAAPTRNLWSALLPSQSQCASCKTKLCNCGLGKLLNSMLTPVSGLTGGVIGPLCPGANTADPAGLAQPADSAEGAAARIKQEEADAKARIAAIQYLATVDCRYFPEATAALVNGLRADPNECVRIAAAKALFVGCCCNKPVITALTRSVNGDDKDGNPGERSECVKAYAYLALQKCLACYTEPEPKPPEPGEAAPAPKEKADAGEAGEIQLAGYAQRSGTRPPEWLTEARQAVARGMNISKETLWRIGGQQTLVGVVTGRPSGFAPPSAAVPASEPVPTAMPSTMPTATTGKKNLFSLWQQAVRPASATQPGS